MTEQMKKALDKAAERLQWSSGQMLIDKKTLQPADPAEVPLERLVCLPVPNLVDTAVHFGANWYRNNVWHEASEEPTTTGKCCFLLIKAKGLNAPRVACYKPQNKELYICGYDLHRTFENYLVEKWAYIEDILPTEGYKEF